METNKSTQDEVTKYKERFIRWQNTRIQQTGFVNNMFIALASGILLWQVQSLSNGSIDYKNHVFYVLSTLSFFVSIVIGCYIAWLRLADFRATANVLRSLIESPASLKDSDAITTRKKLRAQAKQFGESTVWYLPLQFLTFIAGFLFITIDIICSFL